MLRYALSLYLSASFDFSLWLKGCTAARLQTDFFPFSDLQNHGRSIAQHIATGKRVPFSKVPVFWSAQGQQLRYAGTEEASSFEDIIVQGEPDELKFLALYTKGDKVVAAASMQKDPVVAHVSELFRLGKMLSKSEIEAGKVRPSFLSLFAFTTPFRELN